MGTWADLALREIVILVLLMALGAGPSALLRGTQAGSRIALAPGFGLALGAVVLVSVGDVTSLRTATFAAVLPMIVISLALFGAIERHRHRTGGIDLRVAPALKVGLLVVVVASTLSYPLAHRGSLGPVAYRVADASGYAALTDRLESHSISDRSGGAPWDLTSEYGNQEARGTGWLGTSALAASADPLFGWRGSDTQSSWMIALVIIISLGSFAAVQELTASRTWAAVVAGLLMAGPFTYQLFVDGSQGALSLMCLIPPLAVLGSRIISQPRAADIVLAGLLLAAGPTLYQPGAPALAVWIVAVLAVIATAAALQGRLSRDVAWRAAKIVAVVAVLGVAFAPIAFGRAIDFYGNYLDHQFDNAGIPYKLPLGVIPSWLLQSRGLYDINGDPTAASSLFKFVLTVLAPTIFVAVAIFGILRYRATLVVALVVPTAVFLAFFAYLRIGTTTYPVDRNLLIAAVAGAILLSVGLAALTATGRTALRVAAVGTAVLALAFAGRNSYIMASRVLEAGQIVPASVRDSLSHLRGRDGTLYLEGLGAESPSSTLQMPAIYHLVNEATPNRLAVDLTNNDHYGPAYLGGPLAGGASTFDPAYRWVLTVIPSIRTNRETVARVGNVAIQQRSQPLDVTVGSGIATDPPSRDPDGNAWVEGQLKLFLTGAGTGPAWIRLRLEGRPVRVVGPPGARVVARHAASTTICVPAPGTGPVRQSLVSLGFEPAPQPTDAPSAYALPHANHSLRLAGMWGLRRCPGSGA
jgi:hypothetical protein